MFEKQHRFHQNGRQMAKVFRVTSPQGSTQEEDWKNRRRNLMAWAVDAESRRPVYIGDLKREQTGLACGCVCPACDARLQAVNAGRQAEVRRKKHSAELHFRHHTGQQGPGCKSRVAELAALRLLAEQGLIQLPVPRRVGSFVGISGHVHYHEVSGESMQETVISRSYVGETGAILTTASGRTVALVLRGHQEIQGLDSVSAVITVQVDDPEVALMSPEEILARARIPDKWMCLQKHWQDDELQAQAEEAAMQKAIEALDTLPEDFPMPVGATKKQASEGVLHWAIKEALAKGGVLAAPEFRQLLTTTVDGQPVTQQAVLTARSLTVTNVRFEKSQDGYRPDILCTATDPTGRLGTFELLIEVAVTHRVGDEKLARIKRDRVACIEIDVAGFRQGGLVGMPELGRMVMSDPLCKAWLHHEQITGLVFDAQRALRGKVTAVEAAAKARQDEQFRAARMLQLQAQQAEQRAAYERQAVKERKRWFDALSDQQKLAEYLNLLECRWDKTLEVSSNGMPWQKGEFESLLSDSGLGDVLDRQISGGNGLAWQIHTLKRHSVHQPELLDFGAFIQRACEFPNDRSWLGLLFQAFRFYDPYLTPASAPKAESMAETVLNSLADGSRKYARTRVYDRVLSMMFPELEGILGDKVGTVEHCQFVEEQAREVERITREREELERPAKEAQKRLEEKAEAIRLLCFELDWNNNRKTPGSPAEAVKFATIQGKSGDGTAALITSAWQARESHITLPAWIEDQVLGSADEVNELGDLVQAAWLVKRRSR